MESLLAYWEPRKQKILKPGLHRGICLDNSIPKQPPVGVCGDGGQLHKIIADCCFRLVKGVVVFFSDPDQPDTYAMDSSILLALLSSAICCFS